MPSIASLLNHVTPSVMVTMLYHSMGIRSGADELHLYQGKVVACHSCERGWPSAVTPKILTLQTLEKR